MIAVPERFGRSLRVAGDERELNDVVSVPFDLCPRLSLLDLKLDESFQLLLFLHVGCRDYTLRMLRSSRPNPIRTGQSPHYLITSRASFILSSLGYLGTCPVRRRDDRTVRFPFIFQNCCREIAPKSVAPAADVANCACKYFVDICAARAGPTRA